ncbi:hypothetical protein J4402_04935 [Candidatus Pacearchaeota archaeon]|nr:hypothetical protein [Candidatus Pacearchaeota archaeon]
MADKKTKAEEDFDENESSESATREKTDYVGAMRNNPWIVSTVVLGLALIIVLVMNGGIGVTGGVVNGNNAGQNLVDFINSRGDVNASILSVEKDGTLYKAVVDIEGQETPVYITLDGKYAIAQPIPLITETSTITPETTSAEVPKTDKPTADFYVFSYCPYGTQMEKALSPVYNLLKSKADINIVFIGAMHGEYEKTESLRQLCIEDIYGKDKLFRYLDKFLADTAIGACQGEASCVEPLIEKIYPLVGIDKVKVNNCMSKDAEALYAANEEQAQAMGISGSPTTVINGVEVQVGRSPALIQEAICSAFTTAPEECSKTLSTQTASPGFGTGTSSGSSSTASC